MYLSLLLIKSNIQKSKHLVIIQLKINKINNVNYNYLILQLSIRSYKQITLNSSNDLLKNTKIALLGKKKLLTLHLIIYLKLLIIKNPLNFLLGIRRRKNIMNSYQESINILLWMNESFDKKKISLCILIFEYLISKNTKGHLK